MGTRGRHPREGEEITSWMHDRCPAGHCGVGWIAGDVHGMICHGAKGSKPCRKEYLGESAECPGCAKQKFPEWMGYVPLYRHDGKPVFVIIHEHHREQVGNLGLHDYVGWERAEGKGESVAIRLMDRQREWVTYLDAKKRPAVLSRFLPKLWGMPDMLDVCLKEFGDSVSPVSLATPKAPRTTLEKLSDANERFAQENRRIIRDEFGVHPREPEVIGDILPPSANGKPHKK